MALETATFINGLVATNPTGSDPISSGDDHLRLIKATILATFPNITGAVTKTQTQLNNALDKTGDTMTGPLVLSGDPSAALHPATKQYADAGAAAAVTSAVSQAATAAASLYPTKGGSGATGTWGINISGNAATATSATSATSAGNASTVTTVTTAQVLAALASANVGDIGTYALVEYATAGNNTLNPGDVVSGANLRYSGVTTHINQNYNVVDAGQYSSTLSGTWRIMGYAAAANGTNGQPATLALRIS